MSPRAWRAGAALLLAACLACPTMTVAATSSTRTSSSKSLSAAKTGTSTPRRTGAKRKRARRGPPGGVVYAAQAIVVDPTTGAVLYQKNADRSVPIASLTKLMTTLVFLERWPELSREVAVTREDWVGAGHTQLRIGEMVSLTNLLHMSLMCSDNCATRVLARESGVSREDFLAAMNKKALEIGMSHTRFVEFTGLDERNVATAADIAKLVEVASRNPLIHTITTTRSHEFRSAKRAHFIGNTNRLLYGRYEVVGGKTGFINEAGYCFATWVRTQGRDLIAVVLGAPTNATRFADAVRLIQKTSTASIAQNQ